MKKRPYRRVGSALAAVLIGLWASPTGAQVIRGVILDAESAEPVALAYVGLMEPGEELVVAGLADADGGFSLTAPEAGQYFVYVARTGYSPLLEGLFAVEEDGLFELRIGLEPAPLPVDPVFVEVEGGPERTLRSVGYYDRVEIGLGHFIEREEIQRIAIDKLTDAFRNIPQLNVQNVGPNLFVPSGLLNPEVRVSRGTGYCSPTLYIDGGIVAFGSMQGVNRAVRPDDFVDPSEVEAVEIYTGPADTPPRFEATGACGVILIWTRMR